MRTKEIYHVPFVGGQFNTLAQSGTKNNSKKAETSVKLTGTGTDLTEEKVKEKWSKKKIITQTLILNLIDVAKTKKDKQLIKSFWNTYHCKNKITTFEGRAYGKICKNRFCTSCLGIRKAEMIHAYYPVLSQWKTPYFVTLTAKSVPAKNLNHRINQMIRGLNILIDRYEKRAVRGKGNKLVGIRSLECNFNPVKRTYNPHFHLIVKDKATAEILKTEWLKLLTPKFAYKNAQHYRPINDLEKDLIELIKYGTKVFTEPKEDETKKSPQLYAKAFYNIIVAMKGHRLFASFGFKLPPQKEKEKSVKETTEHENWVFNPKLLDWENTITKELLTKFLPTDELRAILGNIDTDLE